MDNNIPNCEVPSPTPAQPNEYNSRDPLIDDNNYMPTPAAYPSPDPYSPTDRPYDQQPQQDVNHGQAQMMHAQVNLFKFNTEPVRVHCLHCNKDVMSVVTTRTGSAQWIGCLVIAAVGCWLGC